MQLNPQDHLVIFHGVILPGLHPHHPINVAPSTLGQAVTLVFEVSSESNSYLWKISKRAPGRDIGPFLIRDQATGSEVVKSQQACAQHFKTNFDAVNPSASTEIWKVQLL